MKEIILFGGGGHCKSVIDVIESEGTFKIAGIIDKKEKLEENVLGYKIIATDADTEKLREEYQYALITVGQIYTSEIREKLYNILKSHAFVLPVIKSPRAYISPHSEIGEGSVIMHGAIVNAGARIGKNCIINSKALIEHDAVVEDHCHISTGAIINGGVHVGKGSFIGSNATIKQYIVIPSNSFIKAGSLIK